MKSKNRFIAVSASLLLFIMSFTTAAQIKQTASVEGITEYKLDNGLKVLLFPDNSSSTITVNITYKVGSRHEGYGEKGMAHLLEHMVFKGTPKHPNIPEELTSHGARPNGTTWYDRTNYFETFNATDENLDWALDLEADRMVNSYIAKKDLESEFSVVRNEFESGENSPSGVLMKKVISAAFMWHNYGQSTIGNRSDIERVPIENLQAFYKKYYRPDNAVLMVTGKFETDKTLALIEKKFSGLKNPSTPLNDVPTIEPPQDGEKLVTLNRVGDLQIVSALYHTPAGSHEDYAAMSIVDKVLNDVPSGRIYKALVDENKASSVWSFMPFTKEPSFIYINVNVPSDKSLPEAEAALLGLLDDLKNNPITEEELNRAKSLELKQIDQLFRNSSFLATYMSEFIGAGDWRLAFINRDRIEEMTVDKVNAAIQRYLIQTNRTVGKFIPTEKPMRVAIEHTENVEELVANYKGKESLGAGEAFDVSYDNIASRLDIGNLEKTVIEYGFITKDNRGETVNLTFTIRNGNINDFMNKGMIASYTAGMLDKGTTTKTRQDIEDKLSALKSSVNINGSNGNIRVTINSTRENLKGALAIMTDMLKNPKFDQTELDKLKTQALASIEQNKTEPQFLAIREIGLLNQNYKKGHPNYNMSIDEEIAAINDVSIEKIQSYYDTFYGISDNATLVAIGNINEQELKDYFEAEFADFKVNKPYLPIADPYIANTTDNVKIKTPDKKNSISFGVLSFEVSQNNEDYAALQMAGAILGGGFLNSRIANRLRQQDGVSYGAGGSVNVDSDNKDKNSSIFVYAIYAPENAAKVQLGFKEEIARFIQDGITEEELQVAINGWVQGQNVSRAKDNELARLINNNLYYNRDLNFQKEIEENVKGLTVDDVNTVIKKYFKTFEEWTVVNAGDFEELKITNEDKKVD
ncbi:M16 family metallopeptidase [Xanthomarina sp. F2636L]|uniref:M16 family metallopeptidase n=1 Tax=Xanthomarina sp. F2636L TaxID=2996018 RepID=UPI00225E206C|nr:pitrilysin family protein [Xanthomarina sp. F2636L]MCX7550048.1 pitrilysin family protein [Xanthomarina sp. F2636L]